MKMESEPEVENWDEWDSLQRSKRVLKPAMKKTYEVPSWGRTSKENWKVLRTKIKSMMAILNYFRDIFRKIIESKKQLINLFNIKMPDAIKKITDTFVELTTQSRGLLCQVGQETDFIFDPETRKKYRLYRINEHERPYNFFA